MISKINAIEKKTKFYLNRLLLIELPKLVVVGNYFIQIFSVQLYVRYQMIASDSPQNSLFPFSCRMITSQNPPSDCLTLSRPLTTSQMPHMSASTITGPLIIRYYGVVLAKYQPEKTTRNVNYYHHQIVHTCKLMQGKVTSLSSLCQENYKIS